jgi:urea carboxylase
MPVESPGAGTIEAVYLQERQSFQPGAAMLALRRRP